MLVISLHGAAGSDFPRTPGTLPRDLEDNRAGADGGYKAGTIARTGVVE